MGDESRVKLYPSLGDGRRCVGVKGAGRRHFLYYTLIMGVNFKGSPPGKAY